MSSSIQRRASRYAMRRRGTKVVANAVQRELPTLPVSARRMASKAARRLHLCALTQHWRVVTPPGDESRIEVSNRRACNIRTLCPQCGYRLSNRLHRRLMRLFDIIGQLQPDYRVLLVTLSTRNRPLLTDLKSMLTDHQAALARYWRLKRLNSVSLGTWTSTELAIRGTWDHPEAGVHSHSLFVVDPKVYFRNDVPAIWHAEFRDLWRQSARLNYDPIVDVRVVRDAEGGSDPDAIYGGIREAAKYVVSSETLFARQNGEVRVDGRVAVAILQAFHRTRLHRFDRIFAEATKLARRKSHPA